MYAVPPSKLRERSSGLCACSASWLTLKHGCEEALQRCDASVLSAPRLAPPQLPVSAACAGDESAGIGRLAPKGIALSATTCIAEETLHHDLSRGQPSACYTFRGCHSTKELWTCSFRSHEKLRRTSNGDLNAEAKPDADAAAGCAAADGSSAGFWSSELDCGLLMAGVMPLPPALLLLPLLNGKLRAAISKGVSPARLGDVDAASLAATPRWSPAFECRSAGPPRPAAATASVSLSCSPAVHNAREASNDRLPDFTASRTLKPV